MLRIEAGNLASACSVFAQMCMSLRAGTKPSRQTLGIVKAELERLIRECSGLSCLKTTLRQAERAQYQFSNYLAGTHDISLNQLDHVFSEVNNRIADELGSQFVFTLPPDAAERYNKPLDGWEPAADRWRNIRLDIEESSKCFAFERFAAAIFHALLVAEFGVIQVGDLMGVSGDRPGWGCVERLQKILVKKFADRTTLEQQHSKFLKSTVDMMIAMKDTWRHKIDHVDNKLIWLDADFSPHIASEIIGSVRGFMRRLAQELP